MKQIMFVLAIIFCINGYSENKESSPTSLKEAYEIAIEEARKWNSNAKLESMISVGNKDDSYENMVYGKRVRWNFSFAVPNSIGIYHIMLHNGEVVFTKELPKHSLIGPLIDINEIKIDSMDALEIAKKNFKIQPGSDWAKGYHFKLYRTEDNIIYQVVCDDSNGYFTKIGIDPITEKIIYAIHKLPSGGGLYKVKNDKLNYLYKKLDIIYASISPNYKEDETIVSGGYKKGLDGGNYNFICLSTNKGKDWRETEIKERIREVWFSDDFKNNKIIYILTKKTLYEYSTETYKMKSIYSGDTPFIRGASYKDKIALLTKEAILLSENKGVTWDSIPILNGIKKINLDKKGNLFAITDNEIFKLKNNKLVKIKKNLDGILLNSQVINDNNLIVNNENTINIINYSKESIYTVDIPDGIKKVFLDYEDGLDGHFYVWTFKNKIIEIQKEGQEYKQIERSLPMPPEGNLINIVSGQDDVFYYCTEELYEWKDFQ